MATHTTSSATVATSRAARYGKQLVSHLGRRSVGNWDESTDSGILEMGEGAARVALSSTPHALIIRLEAAAADISNYENVVARHLERFGERDELQVVWERHGHTPAE